MSNPRLVQGKQSLRAEFLTAKLESFFQALVFCNCQFNYTLQNINWQPYWFICTLESWDTRQAEIISEHNLWKSKKVFMQKMLSWLKRNQAYISLFFKHFGFIQFKQ